MTDICEHCGFTVYVMRRPRVAPKLVHRGTTSPNATPAAPQQPEGARPMTDNTPTRAEEVRITVTSLK
ncbi:hypothetical protein GS944_04570 [Rhodococcus hoagii]|nr:hypothetical protein [Prescottella equi]